MTAFVTSDIPASITTLEQLAVWVTTVLSVLNPETTVEEIKGQLVYVATANQFYMPDAPQGERYRHAARLSIKMDSAYRTEANKVWTYAQPLSTAAIPASMKT
jgi:hypothetical protein